MQQSVFLIPFFRVIYPSLVVSITRYLFRFFYSSRTKPTKNIIVSFSTFSNFFFSTKFTNNNSGTWNDLYIESKFEQKFIFNEKGTKPIKNLIVSFSTFEKNLSNFSFFFSTKFTNNNSGTWNDFYIESKFEQKFIFNGRNEQNPWKIYSCLSQRSEKKFQLFLLLLSRYNTITTMKTEPKFEIYFFSSGDSTNENLTVTKFVQSHRRRAIVQRRNATIKFDLKTTCT